MTNLIHVVLTKIKANWSSPAAARWAKILVFLSLFIFLGSLITYKIPLPAAEDLPRQMANGRDILQGNFEVLTTNFYSYTEPNFYFANHHWLYGVFAYILYNIVGWSGLVVFKIIFILATFSLLFLIALRKADFWLVSLCSIPAIFMLAGRSDFRPELFGYFFVAFYIYTFFKLEENPKSKLIYWLIPAQIIWANIHITWPIGVMLAGGFLFERIVLEPTIPFRKKFSLNGLKGLVANPIIKKLAILTIVLTLVGFINPLGIRGVIYSLTANIGSGDTALVKSSEVQPLSSTIDDLPRWASISMGLVWPILIASLFGFIIGWRRKLIFYFLVFLGSATLTYSMIRGVPFLGIIFLLAFPANLNNLFIRAKDFIISKLKLPKINFEIILNLALALFVVVYMTKNYSTFLFGQEVGVGVCRNLEDSIQFFLENGLKGPIFNDTDIGSYLSYYLYPEERIYADNRFGDAYSDKFFADDYVAAVTDEARWDLVLEKYRFNVIFLYQYDQGFNMRDFMYRRIQDTDDWVFVYGDRWSIILVRNIAQNQAIIDKYAITGENAGQRFSSLTEEYDGYNQVAVGDLYSLMGYPGAAMANYAVAVAEEPGWAKIWFTMGKMELQRADEVGSNTALALMYLQQAIDRGWKTPNSYSFLALAYYRLGQMEKAKEAVNEELKINPKSTDAQAWLGKFARDEMGITEE